MAAVQRHELDEAQRQALRHGPAGQRQDLVLVDAAHHHRVQLEREAGLARGDDAVQHRLHFAIAGELGEGVGRQRVEADVEVVQTGGLEAGGALRQQGGVGGERDALQAQRAQFTALGHHRLEVAPQQRLAAGEAQVGHAQFGDEQAQQLLQLAPRQPLAALHELRAVRHAVGAAEVAAVGEGDAQLALDPPVAVLERTAEQLGQRHGRGGWAGKQGHGGVIHRPL